MKINIGPYPNYYGPYQVAEKLLFWLDKDHKLVEELGHKLSKWNVFDVIHGLRKRRIRIKIHKYDTWNMDSTLALIILPMLKQLKETKHGSAIVDLEDVPQQLRYTTHHDYDQQLLLPFYEEDEDQLHVRWDYVLNEMIWTFEQLNTDWESQYYEGTPDFPNKDFNFKIDLHNLNKHQDRINNGLKLFGKYYQGLWD